MGGLLLCKNAICKFESICSGAGRKLALLWPFPAESLASPLNSHPAFKVSDPLSLTSPTCSCIYPALPGGAYLSDAGFQKESLLESRSIGQIVQKGVYPNSSVTWGSYGEPTLCRRSLYVVMGIPGWTRCTPRPPLSEVGRLPFCWLQPTSLNTLLSFFSVLCSLSLYTLAPGCDLKARG